jgi:biopolymer transport protein ExbB
LFNVVKKGGLFMIPIFACSFILLVFVFERAISLRRARVIPGPFVKKLFHQMREGKLDRDQALDLCQENPCTVSEVLAVAIRKWGRPAVEMEQAIMDAGERAANGLRRYLRLFNAISTISPLLGLLGTVFGMIHMFNELSVSGTVGRTELFAGGISEALLTTASGLSVAIPALCFYLIFLSRVDRLLIDIDAAGQELIGIISSEALQEDRQAKLRPKARATTAA